MNLQGVRTRLRCAARVGFRRRAAVSPPDQANAFLFSEAVIHLINTKYHHTAKISFIPHPSGRGSPGGSRDVPRRRPTARGAKRCSVAFLPPVSSRCPCWPAAAPRTTGGSAARRPGHRPAARRPGRRRRHPALGRGRRAGDAEHLPGGRRRRHRRVAQARAAVHVPARREGRPQRNADYLESAKVVETEPKQVVLYKLNQQAVWSDGREIGAADFAAQWRALSGKDSAYWTARNAGYDRIEKIERGKNDLEVKVTFAGPTPTGGRCSRRCTRRRSWVHPDSFNDGARKKLEGHGRALHREEGRPRGRTRSPWSATRAGGATRPSSTRSCWTRYRRQRAEALAAGRSTWPMSMPRTPSGSLAGRGRNGLQPLTGPGSAVKPADALISWAVAHGADGPEAAKAATEARERTQQARKQDAAQQHALRGYRVRKSLEPAYTQLALNGSRPARRRAGPPRRGPGAGPQGARRGY